MAVVGLIGAHDIGAIPIWPSPAVTVADVMNRPPWERPTEDTGYTQPSGSGPDFSGESATGFEGGSGTGTPGFEGGYYPGGSSWSPGSGGAGDGGTIIVLTDHGPVSLDITASRRDFYRVEVYDTSGDMVSRLPQLISGSLSEQMDKASTLRFRVPADSEGASDLVRPNYVWLRDRWGFVTGTFQIQKLMPRGDGDASYYDIECQSDIAQLADEVVLKYEAATTNVSAHVQALMALQAKSNALTLGDIDSTIAAVELPFIAADTNIHAALLRLQAALPKAQRGHIYIDPQRRLQWRLAIGDTTEQVITRGRNVYSIEAETDYTRMVNQLYLYGEGQDPDTRLTLVDAGEAAEYIEDAASITANGLQAVIKQDRRIKDADTLLLVAQRLLEEFATPPTTVRVDLLDLAKTDDAPDGWQDIYIGGAYRVVDGPLSLDTSIEIVGIETDLLQPVPLRVDLTNQTRTLSDVIGAILDAMNQPLDVLGDRYPNMGRNLSDGAIPDAYRAGDTRWNSDEGQAEMYDGDSWEEMGSGGIPLYTADEPDELEEPESIEAYALGFITAGDYKGAWYERNADNDGWQGRTVWETSS